MADRSGGVAGSVKWSSVSQTGRVGTQLLSVVVLARLLPPGDFGLIAMSSVVTGFAAIFRDMGTSSAIIRKSEVAASLLDSVFWLNIAAGLAVAAFVALSAPVIAWSFAEPRLVEILWALSAVFPLASAGAVYQALLERERRFRVLARVEVVAAVAGLLSAVSAAFAGWGAFSLVCQVLVSAAASTFQLARVARWRPRPRWDRQQIGKIVGFSGNLVGFNILNYVARNLDSVLIGRFLGATDLGFYTIAYKLMLWPVQNITAVVGRALFPTWSRSQNDTNELARGYLQATAGIAFLTAPLMWGLFVLRDPLIDVAIGSKWHESAAILAWLAPVGFLQSVVAVQGVLYMVKGRTDLFFRWGLLVGAVTMTAFVAGLRWGVEGVACGYFVSSLLLFFPSFVVPFRFLGLKPRAALVAIVPPSACALAMAAGMVLADRLLSPDALLPGVRLAVLLAVGASIYASASWRFQRELARSLGRALAGR